MVGVAEEMIDVITPAGTWTGVTKPKSAVHRDGDWHACVHGVITDGRGNVLAQFRGPGVNLMRNVWDTVSVAGHISALTAEERQNHPELWDIMQQAWRALVREFAEEVNFNLFGYQPFTDDVVMFGVTRTDQPTEDGWRDRTLAINFMIRIPDFDIKDVQLEEGKVLDVCWISADELELGIVHGGRDYKKIAIRQPDHEHLVLGIVDCARRMMLTEPNGG